MLTNVTQTVDFESFSKILNRPGGFRDPGEPEEYCRGFQVFDKDMTGFIGVGQLRYSTSFCHLKPFVIFAFFCHNPSDHGIGATTNFYTEYPYTDILTY